MVRPGVTTRKPRVNLLAAGLADGVDRLPGDDHRHDGGLAGAGGQLQRETHQFRVRAVVGIGEVLEKPLARFAQLRGDLGQPDRGFHSFDLAEEGANIAELMMTPMLKETCSVGRHLPIDWDSSKFRHWSTWKRSSLMKRCRIVLLLFRRESLTLVKDQFCLGRLCSALPRLRYWCDEFSTSAISMIRCVGWPCSSSSQY